MSSSEVGEINTGVSALRPIKAVIQPGFDSTVSMRIVPGRDLFKDQPVPGCKPRGDRQAPERPHPLPGDLVIKLTEANTKMMSWLAGSNSNAMQFIDSPVAALEAAGVQLTRAEAKVLSRLHAAMREDVALPPGAQMSMLSVSATKRGKVGDVRPARPRPDRSEDKPTTITKPAGHADGCDC